MNLQSKHNFTMAHFGLLLGVLKSNLQELQIQHCNDIFCRTTQVSLAAPCLLNLQRTAEHYLPLTGHPLGMIDHVGMREIQMQERFCL